MNKLVIATLVSMMLLSGCDNAKNDAVTNTPQGNFSAKVETLSSQNESDIKADLTALNAVINTSNSQSQVLAKKLMEVGPKGDKEALRSILNESKKLLESTNASLFALNLKSGEVQDIRSQVYQGNMLAIKLHDIAEKDGKSEESRNELNQIQQQLIVLQQTVGEKLDKLNSQYKIQ